MITIPATFIVIANIIFAASFVLVPIFLMILVVGLLFFDYLHFNDNKLVRFYDHLHNIALASLFSLLLVNLLLGGIRIAVDILNRTFN